MNWVVSMKQKWREEREQSLKSSMQDWWDAAKGTSFLYTIYKSAQIVVFINLNFIIWSHIMKFMNTHFKTLSSLLMGSWQSWVMSRPTWSRCVTKNSWLFCSKMNSRGNTCLDICIWFHNNGWKTSILDKLKSKRFN